MRLAAALIVTVIAFAPGGPAGQGAPQGQPTFRAGVELVQVDVSVLDTQRRPIEGLTAADFTVKEDGKVRPIVAFNAVEVPSHAPLPGAAWVREVAPDVVTNAVPREGRLVVILFDRTVGIANMRLARQTAQEAVAQMGPADLAAVIYTARGVPQNFTADRQLLRSAIARPFMGLSDADLAGDPSPGPDQDSEVERGNPGECRCGVCALEAMTRVADALRDVPQRRKMLLFLGSRLPVQSNGPCAGMVRDTREKLFRAAEVANLAIHTVDSTGLETLGPTADVAGRGRPYGGSGNLQRQGDLGVYADRTGGRAIVNTNAPESQVPAIFAESRSYYVLGIEPASTRRDGRLHEIKVEVARPGVSVHSRRGHYAASNTAPPGAATTAKGKPAPSLVGALAGLWPRTEVPMQLSVAPFAIPGRSEAGVSVVIHAREPISVDGRPPTGPVGTQRINVLAGAYGNGGESLDSHVQTVEVTPAASAQTTIDYEITSSLTLKPGRHEIRVASENVTRGTRASVYGYVDIPDFTKAALSLSGVVLGTSAGGRKPAGPLSDVIPFPPVARREFASADRVTAFVRVYQGGSGAARPVMLTTRVLDDQNQALFEQRAPAFDQQGSAPRSFDHQVDLPLDQLKPGEYLLRIEAGGQQPTATRDVRFTVR